MNVLVLDTSVFVRLKSPKMKGAVLQMLDSYESGAVYISEMTVFEFIRHCNNLDDIKHHISMLSIAKRFAVDTSALKHATYYYNVLVKSTKHDGSRAISANQLSDSDIIIGATAMRYNAMICTTDRNDFPSPYFDEIAVFPFLDTKEKLYVLEPDKQLYEEKLESIFS